MTKKEKRFIGLALMAAGAFIFMKQTRIYSWGWRSYESAPAVILVLLVVSAALYVAFPKPVIRYAVYALLAALIAVVVLNVRMYFSGSLLTLLLTLLPVAAGAGLCISSVSGQDDEG